MPEDGFRVIVIGASAGGVEALSRLVKTLPADFAAPIFVVLHVSPHAPSLLPGILERAGKLPARHARDGEKIKSGTIYIAPPDHHLLLKPGQIAVTRGPRENNSRPAVDPLFRTAARSYGPRVVGVVLSGGLDDGTLGLMDVKRAGGVTLAQDPDETMFPSMPRSAIENVVVDRVLKVEEMGVLLARLAREPVVSQNVPAEAIAARNGFEHPDIAEVGTDNLRNQFIDAPPSKFTCPECGGALWELENGSLLRYRCHIGHGYTADNLMVSKTDKLEDALSSALRALEEVAGFRRRMAERARRGGWYTLARSYIEMAQTAEARAGLIRSVLTGDRPQEITDKTAEVVEIKAIDAADPDARIGSARNRLAGSRNSNKPALRSSNKTGQLG
jgi:two-component system chemotaxis response regulator CheB